MEKIIIQNETVEKVVNKEVQETTQDIFKEVIGLDYYNDIGQDIAEAFIRDLKNASFMTIDLELTENQKEVLKKSIPSVVRQAFQTYAANLDKDKRRKHTVQIIEKKIRSIIEITLRDIGQEINRGCIINSYAVKADAKNEKYNTIELQHSKISGDITVPTKGIFCSSNCVDTIINSIRIEQEKEQKKEK